MMNDDLNRLEKYSKIFNNLCCNCSSKLDDDYLKRLRKLRHRIIERMIFQELKIKD